MGNYVYSVHNSQDDKLYNILGRGDLPCVVFGRVIREHSVPGMQYYFSDGRVKFKKSGFDTMSNSGGWDAVIPFTKLKIFSAIKFDSNDGDTWLYRRYRKIKGWYAWAYCNTGNNKEITDSSVDWSDIDYTNILYTNNDAPNIGDYDILETHEILDFNDNLTSESVNPTQLPVIFTVPEDLDFSRMNDVEYVRQFCRTAVNLNANTMSSNFVIRNGKIICVKEVDFGSNEALSNNGKKLNAIYKSRFRYKYLISNCRTRKNSRKIGKYRMIKTDKVKRCIHNEFNIIPVIKRNRSKLYYSVKEYQAYRYGRSMRSKFQYWNNWKLK